MKSILSLDDFLQKAGTLTAEDEDTLMIDGPAVGDSDVDSVELTMDIPKDGDDDDVNMPASDENPEIEMPSQEQAEEDDENKEEKEPETAGEMAHGQLERCIDYSKMLRQRIQPGDDVEPWIAAKITKSMDYLQSVFNYLDGKDGEEEEEEGE